MAHCVPAFPLASRNPGYKERTPASEGCTERLAHPAGRGRGEEGWPESWRTTGYETSIFGWWSLLLISPPYISLWRWQYYLLASVEIWVGLDKFSLIFFTEKRKLAFQWYTEPLIFLEISVIFFCWTLLTNCITFNNQITSSDKISKAHFLTWTQSHTCRHTLSHVHSHTGSHTHTHFFISFLPPCSPHTAPLLGNCNSSGRRNGETW